MFYEEMFEEDFLYNIHVLYYELELKGLSEEESEYPYSFWLHDLYELIEKHKEELKI